MVTRADSEQTYPIVVIGGSAGALTPLVDLVGALPADLNAAIFVVIHFPASQVSVLPEILTRGGPVPATHVLTETTIRPGAIYVAPPGDAHMEIAAGVVRPVRSDPHFRFRPAIDPLFTSAARAYGDRVIGVLLSGHNHDGIAGLRAIQAAGGMTMVQDPTEAEVPRLPLSASATLVDGAWPARDIAARIVAAAASRKPAQRRARSAGSTRR